MTAGLARSLTGSQQTQSCLCSAAAFRPSLGQGTALGRSGGHLQLTQVQKPLQPAMHLRLVDSLM